MSQYIRDIFEEMQDVIIGAVPELVGGVWTVTQVQKVPFETLQLPYAVVEIDQMIADEQGEWGAVSNSYTFSPYVYVVREQVWNGLEIAEDLELIRDTFSQTDMQTCQFVSAGNLEWGDQLEANQFFDSKDTASRAGRIALTFQVGESLNG